MMQLTSAVILCLSLFGSSVTAKPGYASGYDVDYYVSCEIQLLMCEAFETTFPLFSFYFVYTYRSHAIRFFRCGKFIDAKVLCIILRNFKKEKKTKYKRKEPEADRIVL